jgi:hypothetical protein
MTCKNCGATLVSDKRMVGDFCGESCFWAYSGEPITEIKEVVFFEEKPEVAPSVYLSIHLNCIKRLATKPNGAYIISNKSLQPYLCSKPFDKFLKDNKLMVVRQDDELSVIKKSIL